MKVPSPRGWGNESHHNGVSWGPWSFSVTQRPSTGTLVKWVDCRPKLPTSLELLTLFSAMVQLGLALLWWLIPLKKHTTEIQALARWSFGKRFSAVVIACPIPRLDPNNIKNKQVFQFPMLSTFFHHFSTCSSLPRYEFERVSTTRHGFRSDPTRHCSDGHPLPRGTHRLRAGPDGFTGDLRRLLAGSVHVPFRNWHCTAPEQWIHMCICTTMYVTCV